SGPDAEHQHEVPLHIDAQQADHHGVFNTGTNDQAQPRAVQHVPAGKEDRGRNGHDLEPIQRVGEKAQVARAFTPCWQGYALPHPAINAPDDLNNDDADAEGDQYLIFMGSVIEALDQPPLHDEPHCHGDYRRPDQADYEGTCGGEYGEACVSADNKQGAVGKVDDSQRTVNDGETCRNECQQHTQSQAVKNLRHEKAHARPPSFAFVMQIWMQPISAPETMLVSGARTSSGGRAHLATCVVHRRQGLQTVGNGNHVNQIILVLDFRGLLAANDGEVGDPVVVFRTEVDFAAHAVRTLVINAVLEGLYHGGRVEGAG